MAGRLDAHGADPDRRREGERVEAEVLEAVQDA